MLKKNRIMIGFLILAIIITAFYYYFHVQTTWVTSHPYSRSESPAARVLVVVYSRTGNTFGAAKTIARYFDADIVQIKAPQYGLTVEGQMRASKDADQELTSTPIQHKPVDMSLYDLIFLCSPTWWFRPAVPLWSFVENHNFEGRPVFLIMTGNSRYKTELTDKFSTLVSQKKGSFQETLFVRRGRIYWQKTPGEVNSELQDALNERKNLWEGYVGSYKSHDRR